MSEGRVRAVVGVNQIITIANLCGIGLRIYIRPRITHPSKRHTQLAHTIRPWGIAG